MVSKSIQFLCSNILNHINVNNNRIFTISFWVGIPNVDDVLLNTIGGGIGYGLLKVIVCFKSTYK